MEKPEITQEILDEAAKWTIVSTVTKTYLDRHTDELRGSSSSTHKFSPRKETFIIEDGKLVGFNLNKDSFSMKIGEFESNLMIPDGKARATDSYSSYDWEESVYEEEICTLERKEN